MKSLKATEQIRRVEAIYGEAECTKRDSFSQTKLNLKVKILQFLMGKIDASLFSVTKVT